MATITTEFSITYDVVISNSANSYAECFKQIANFLKPKRNAVISHIKARHSSDGYEVSVFLLREIEDSKS